MVMKESGSSARYSILFAVTCTEEVSLHNHEWCNGCGRPRRLMSTWTRRLAAASPVSLPGLVQTHSLPLPAILDHHPRAENLYSPVSRLRVSDIASAAVEQWKYMTCVLEGHIVERRS